MELQIVTFYFFAMDVLGICRITRGKESKQHLVE
jgi:hypothetical protein